MNFKIKAILFVLFCLLVAVSIAGITILLAKDYILEIMVILLIIRLYIAYRQYIDLFNS